MTTNQYQSEVVNAFGVFAKIIMATATERAELHTRGIHVLVEMLTDGLCISHRVPSSEEEWEWERLRKVLSKIKDILWHEGHFTCNDRHLLYHDIHTYICNGTWDIQWPELNESGAITYDNGGQQQWN